MPSAPVENFDFIVNRRGGTVLKTGEEKVRAEILSRFGDKAGAFSFVEGNEIASAVKAWAEEHAGQNRGLVIGGGDGTVVTAVGQILGQDITLGVLPLGTQNLFAQQLGFPADFKAAAERYNKKGQTVAMDVGVVNGVPFLVGLTLDRNTVNLFEAREDLRDKKRFSALKKISAFAAGFMAAKKQKLSVATGDDGQNSKEIKGRVIAITNNRMSPRAIKRLPFSAAGLKNIYARVIAKGKEPTGELSLYAFGGGPFKTAGILPRIFAGTWDRSKSVKIESATHFIIQSKGAKEASLTLDGDLKTMQYPLDVRIIPNGVRMFMPV
jgi:diacylglycerol kinase family enzyme